MNVKRKRKIIHSILFIVLLILGISMVMPFLWTLSASFKFKRDIFSYPIDWIPSTLYVKNYIDLWTTVPFLTYYLNTLKVTVIVTTGQLIISSMAAYAFGRMQFKGRDKIFFIYLMTMMVPWQAIMIPQFIIVSKLGLYDTHTAIIILQLFSAFSIFLLRQFMMNIPMELSEAARLDGAKEFSIMTRIILPMCKPALATLTVFTFNFMWNDYLGPMIYLGSDSKKTIQLGLASFRKLYNTEYGLIMAGTICALLPMVLIFIFAQKYLMSGISFNGIKS